MTATLKGYATDTAALKGCATDGGSPKGLRYAHGSPKGLRYAHGSPKGLRYGAFILVAKSAFLGKLLTISNVDIVHRQWRDIVAIRKTCCR
jgi:hypothetical protein